MNLTAKAIKALINANGSHQGAEVPVTTLAAEFELQDAGLIGKGNGLTRKGTIVRERLVNAALEAAFA